MKTKKRFGACFLLLILSACIIMPVVAQEDKIGALFINVDKADAALFVLGDKRFLIDTGTKGSFEQLQQALVLCKVDHLDGVLITHMHKDHAGGLKKLLKSGIEVDHIYAGTFYADKYIGDHPAMEAVEKYNVPLSFLKAGDEINLGNGCVFHILGPLRADRENENNNSLYIRLTTPQGDMLLTGDMEQEEEADVISAGLVTQAPVLKVSHHGRDDASTKDFLYRARPIIAVISTNTKEEPRSPAAKVLRLLDDVHAQVFVTQDASVGIWVTLKEGIPSAELVDR